MSKLRLSCLIMFFCFLNFSSPANALILINEFLADPPNGLAGDANGDGVGSTSQDEFIEIYNTSNMAVDISGWTLSDEYKIRHVFPTGSIIPANELFVIFGGGIPEGTDFFWQVASSSSLGLNNSGDLITLNDVLDNLMDDVSYGSEANSNQSLVRFPETDPNAGFVRHADLPDADGLRFSPGFLMSDPIERAVVPEPVSLISLGWGLLSLSIWQKRRMMIAKRNY